MANYKPATPFNVPFKILIPDKKTVKGTTVKIFKVLEEQYFCSFKTFGGTEKVANNIIITEDTAVIETWYTPLITASCNIIIHNKTYEIMGTPENINMQNQYMKFKVRCINGGA